MQALREQLRKTPLGTTWGDLKYMFETRLPWQFSPTGQAARDKLAQLKDKHRGERAFILGNGPSLKRTDLSRIQGEYSFGTNRLYLIFDQTDFRPSYYLVVNHYVLEQFIGEVLALSLPTFIPYQERHLLPDGADLYLYPTLRQQIFSKNPQYGLSTGHTVTFICMQLAYYMGFSQVILIGVDHYFKAEGENNKLVESKGDDVDHFHPGYFGKGIKWQLPDLDNSELAYMRAKDAFEADGREILDATIDGKLQVFPKVDYDAVTKRTSS